MGLPQVTHLQFLVLAWLAKGEQFGRAIRARLEEMGELKSGPAFYQMMGRLEGAGFVRGRYDQKVVDGQIIKQRRYRITAAGRAAGARACAFYLEHRPEFGGPTSGSDAPLELEK